MKLIAMILLLAGMLVGLARAVDGPLHGRSTDYEDLISSICFPTDAAGDLDINAPCNAAYGISTQCEKFSRHYDGDEDEDDELMNNCGHDHPQGWCSYCNDASDDHTICYKGPEPFPAQQICYCSSQFFDVGAGCISCLVMHGLSEGVFDNAPENFTELSSTFCDTSFTVTDALVEYVRGPLYDTPSPKIVVSTPGNVLGTATDASLYFTPASVTGSEAYIVPDPTLTVAQSVKDGQIKPAALANYDATATTNKPVSPANVTNARAPSLNVKSVGIVGAIGLVGLVLVL